MRGSARLEAKAIATGRKAIRKDRVEEEEEEVVVALPSSDPRPNDVAVDLFPSSFPLRARDVTDFIDRASEATVPDTSVVFLGIFIAATYFHESHFVFIAPLVVAWAVLQVLSMSFKDDFRYSLFWNVATLVGKFILYLIVGSIWAVFKIYFDIWQGQFDPRLTLAVRKCVESAAPGDCWGSVMLQLKGPIGQFMVSWPISVAYTLCRDPFHIIKEVMVRNLNSRFMYFATLGLKHHDAAVSGGAIGDATPLLWMGFYIVTYLAIGYAWTHIKLFLDVWQGSLPPALDQEVRDVYNSKDASYWSFVLHIKWLVIEWMFTWPVSVILTVFQHPFRIIANIVYRLSQRTYMWITQKAMAARVSDEKEEKQE